MTWSLVTLMLAVCLFNNLVVGNEHEAEHEDDSPVHYSFEYGVHDPHTGDKKEHHEVRDGHVVKGVYKLEDPDGTTRIVEYTADPHLGFNAVVKRIGEALHPEYHHHHQSEGGSGHQGDHYGGAYSTVGVTHYGYDQHH